MGAFDFVSKPVDLSVLRKLVNTALKLAHEAPGEQEDDGEAQPLPSGPLDRMVGNSASRPEMQADDRQAVTQPGACSGKW